MVPVGDDGNERRARAWSDGKENRDRGILRLSSPPSSHFCLRFPSLLTEMCPKISDLEQLEKRGQH